MTQPSLLFSRKNWISPKWLDLEKCKSLYFLFVICAIMSHLQIQWSLMINTWNWRTMIVCKVIFSVMTLFVLHTRFWALFRYYMNWIASDIIDLSSSKSKSSENIPFCQIWFLKIEFLTDFGLKNYYFVFNFNKNREKIVETSLFCSHIIELLIYCHDSLFEEP